MHMRKILPALVGLSLGASGAAYAQGNPRPQDEPGFRPYAGAPPQNLPPQQRGDQRGQRDQRDQRGQRNDYRGNDNRGNDYRGARNDYRGHDGRGAGPDHAWYRGGRLPPEYRGRQYVVDDWRGHRLSAPPRGYHWVQAGGDYVLAAIATGVIASILLNQ